MSLDAWLAARLPSPPENLAVALRSPGRERTDAASRADQLARAGRARLEKALDRTGRERASAFRLLEADALFTYACEAALGDEDPRPALGRALAMAAS